MSSVLERVRSGQRAWTIPPGEDFLSVLARVLAEETGLSDDPAALADALIYVPNRRSARTLAMKLYEQGGGKPILPPDIRALGDLESDEPPTGTEEAIAGLGPALSPGRRLGALASMVLQFYEARGLPLPPRSAVSAAQELSRLLDQAALSGDVDWSRLPDLVTDTDLAQHWAQSAEFLRIVTEYWPEWLAANGASEPFERRLAVAEAIATHWDADPPKGLVVIAGSTGATPASRALMRAARNLDTGLVVFPGLDGDMPEAQWRRLEAEPDHPQHALANTLSELGISRADINLWPTPERPSTASARAKLIHESLAPASDTANWLFRLEDLSGDATPAEFARDALDGLTIKNANTEEEEALFAALLLRETLEKDNETAALVTPDAGLARRVSQHLTRWGITLPPSSGEPLLRSQAGRFIGLIAEWMLDPSAPVALMALLKHPFISSDADSLAVFEKTILRGPRTWSDLDELLDKWTALDSAYTAAKELREVWHQYGLDLEVSANGTGIANAIASLAQALAISADTPWSGTDGAAAARLLETFTEVAGALPPLRLADAADMLVALADQVSLPLSGSQSRLAIWGPLEARLQTADHLILAGLNEGVWPVQPSPDAYLPRKFRTALGLSVPEARLGLAAHDFAQLAAAPRVTCLLSERRDDAPAVASRWIWRLQTLAEGALGKDEAAEHLAPPPGFDLDAWADALTSVPPAERDRYLVPEPRPPVESRPKRLSVTRINTLQRDPYAIYCEQILKLSKLRLLDELPDPRLRGTAIHAALEWLDTAPIEDQTPATLANRMAVELAAAGEAAEALVSDRAIRLRTAEWVIGWYRDRQAELSGDAVQESGGSIELPIAGSSFKLTAFADRIETKTDGTLAIIDYKTGDPPSNKQVFVGLEQQMPLQAMIAEAGGFQGVPAKPVGELLYVSVKSKSYEQRIEKPVRGDFEPKSPSELAADARSGLEKLLTQFAQPETPYLSAPRPEFRSSYEGDFERLARRAEWGGDVTDG